MLLAALLPNVSYMGRWPIAGADVHLEAGVDPASVIAEHESHCHIGPANCGGGESMVGTPFAGEDKGVLSLPASEMKFDAGHDYGPPAGHATRILQPPRLANDADVQALPDPERLIAGERINIGPPTRRQRPMTGAPCGSTMIQ